MALGRVFDRFARYSPVTVMMRGIMEYVFPSDHLDQLFREHAVMQQENELLFSLAVDTLGLAVTGTRKSVNSAYEACKEEFSVSVNSLYNKLQGVETPVSRALVRESTLRLKPVIEQLGAQAKPLLPGYRAKILDGKHLSATERRIEETRFKTAAPLPGQALVVLDPQLRLALDVFPCEDAYAQERSLLNQVLETVEAGDLWIGDRNFCTTGFLFGIRERNASFLIRQHGRALSGKKPIGHRRRVGRSDTGTVYEQTLEIRNPQETDAERQVLRLRRITVKLDKPTRDGDTEIHLLTDVPEEHADAITIAELYHKRWKIEYAFQELGQALNSEVDTLCYPKAALLAFCVGLYTYNMLSVLKAAMRSAHKDPSLLDELSGYYLGEEIAATYFGMIIAIDSKHWTKTFARLPPREMAKLLRELAASVNISRFKKRRRKTRNPAPKKTGDYRDHTSTARILEGRKKKKAASR